VHIDAMCRVVMNQNPSAIVVLPRQWRFRRDYNTAVLEYCGIAPEGSVSKVHCDEVKLMPGVNLVSPGRFALSLRQISAHEPSFPDPPWHPPSRFEAYFDAAAATMLTARGLRPGDRIRPLGLSGSRKIHDVFIDNKIAVAERASWPLITLAGEVVWIPGLIRSRVALVTPASRKVLHLRADSQPGGVRL
jgi:tRNA(Ile)-lysidine synthetase-like protein